MTMRRKAETVISRGPALLAAVFAVAAAGVSDRVAAYPAAPLPPMVHDGGEIVTVAARKSASAAQVQAAIDLAQKHKFDEAFTTAKRNGDPVLEKIVEWFYVQSTTARAGFERIAAFSRANPTWPRLSTIDARAELALYLERPVPGIVTGHFARTPPRTGAGGLALARAHLALGNKKQAREWIGRTWRGTDLSETMERAAIKEMGALIDTRDRRHRLALMIYRQQTRAAIRAASFLPKAEQAMTRAAVAFLRRSNGAGKLFSKVPAALRDDPALTYARVHWNRKRNRDDAARKLLLAAPFAKAKQVHPESWWDEQRILARDVLVPGEKKTYRTAYRLVAGHKLTSGAEFVDAEFMAGWIALRFLQEPGKALTHFRAVMADATIPETKARADYWIARSHAALKQDVEAEKHMKAAAALSTTYYGQLARDHLGLDPDPTEFHARPSAPKAVLEALEDTEHVRAIALIAKTDERSLLVAFGTALAQNLDTSDERLALAEIVWKLEAPHVTLRISRIAETRGDNFGRLAFPTSLLPDYKPLVPVKDKALVYGLIRQESEFNPRAKSWAGAGGLMQIMPATAKLIAREHRQPYSQSRLIDDPAYNVRLGSAHIHDLVRDFNGSYIMALAGYNAGPGRSQQWMKRFGDPRTGAIDPIDWVELIPFSETRHYVQKVLQNIQVYRSLFPGDRHVPLVADLNRGADEESASVQNCQDEDRRTMAILIACSTQ